MSSSQQMFSDGKARGEGQAKADEVLQPAADKASDAAQSAHESSEKATAFLQQTGEQVMYVAREAADAVKNAVGMGTTDAWAPPPPPPSRSDRRFGSRLGLWEIT